MSKVNGGRVESCRRIKGGNGRLAVGEDEVLRTWKGYFEAHIGTQEQVAVHMYGFDGVQRGNYYREEPIRRTEVEARVGKIKNGKAAGKDEVTKEMIKGGGDMVVDWIWRLCNMAFESSAMPKDWRPAVKVPLYKGKGEKTKCRNYRGITLSIMVGKMYAVVLVNRVHRVTEGLTDDKQGGFR